MGVLSIVNRLLVLAAGLLVLLHAPLFSAYGFGTGMDKVRLAPASYFVLGLEQVDYVKKSRRLTGMVNDLGVWLHAPAELAEDYGVAQAVADAIGYKSVWKSKQKERAKNKKKSKKKKRTKRK